MRPRRRRCGRRQMKAKLYQIEQNKQPRTHTAVRPDGAVSVGFAVDIPGPGMPIFRSVCLCRLRSTVGSVPVAVAPEHPDRNGAGVFALLVK